MTLPGRRFIVGAFHDGRSRSWSLTVNPTAPESDPFTLAMREAEARAESAGDPIPEHAFLTIAET